MKTALEHVEDALESLGSAKEKAPLGTHMMIAEKRREIDELRVRMERIINED